MEVVRQLVLVAGLPIKTPDVDATKTDSQKSFRTSTCLTELTSTWMYLQFTEERVAGSGGLDRTHQTSEPSSIFFYQEVLVSANCTQRYRLFILLSLLFQT